MIMRRDDELTQGAVVNNLFATCGGMKENILAASRMVWSDCTWTGSQLDRLQGVNQYRRAVTSDETMKNKTYTDSHAITSSCYCL